MVRETMSDSNGSLIERLAAAKVGAKVLYGGRANPVTVVRSYAVFREDDIQEARLKIETPRGATRRLEIDSPKGAYSDDRLAEKQYREGGVLDNGEWEVREYHDVEAFEIVENGDGREFTAEEEDLLQHEPGEEIEISHDEIEVHGTVERIEIQSDAVKAWIDHDHTTGREGVRYLFEAHGTGSYERKFDDEATTLTESASYSKLSYEEFEAMDRRQYTDAEISATESAADGEEDPETDGGRVMADGGQSFEEAAEGFSRGERVEFEYSVPDCGDVRTGTGTVAKSNRGGIRVLPDHEEHLLVFKIGWNVTRTHVDGGATRLSKHVGERASVRPTGATRGIEYDHTAGWRHTEPEPEPATDGGQSVADLYEIAAEAAEERGFDATGSARYNRQRRHEAATFAVCREAEDDEALHEVCDAIDAIRGAGGWEITAFCRRLASELREEPEVRTDGGEEPDTCRNGAEGCDGQIGLLDGHLSCFECWLEATEEAIEAYDEADGEAADEPELVTDGGQPIEAHPDDEGVEILSTESAADGEEENEIIEAGDDGEIITDGGRSVVEILRDLAVSDRVRLAAEAATFEVVVDDVERYSDPDTRFKAHTVHFRPADSENVLEFAEGSADGYKATVIRHAGEWEFRYLKAEVYREEKLTYEDVDLGDLTSVELAGDDPEVATDGGRDLPAGIREAYNYVSRHAAVENAEITTVSQYGEEFDAVVFTAGEPMDPKNAAGAPDEIRDHARDLDLTLTIGEGEAEYVIRERRVRADGGHAVPDGWMAHDSKACPSCGFSPLHATAGAGRRFSIVWECPECGTGGRTGKRGWSSDRFEAPAIRSDGGHADGFKIWLSGGCEACGTHLTIRHVDALSFDLIDHRGDHAVMDCFGADCVREIELTPSMDDRDNVIRECSDCGTVNNLLVNPRRCWRCSEPWS